MGKKIVIIGGVAGGSGTATRLRRLDETAHIVMFERTEHISFAECGMPYYLGGVIKDRQNLLVVTTNTMIANFNIDVRTATEVVAIDRSRKVVRARKVSSGEEYEESYDKLVIATGAKPVQLALPGSQLPHVDCLRGLWDMDRICQRMVSSKDMVLVGAGFIGLELAENFARRGLAVTVVELMPQVCPPLDMEMAKMVQAELQAHGVRFCLSDSVTEIAEIPGDASQRMRLTLRSGGSLEADEVILGVGVQPESDLAKAAGLALGRRGGILVDQHMLTADRDIYAVGDVVETRDVVTGEGVQLPLAGPAARQARVCAGHIAGHTPSVFRGVQGTAILKVFDLAAACTGANERTLRRMGQAFCKAYLHPPHHVKYFQGARTLHIKLLFEPDTGRLLGAQVVGQEAVDKEIDVLALAIQTRLTVFDLEASEMAYCPQFGASKSPINMCGFLGAGMIRGDARYVFTEDFAQWKDDSLILDIREAAELRAFGVVPGSVNFPMCRVAEAVRKGGGIAHETMRAARAEGKRVVVVCQQGQRAYSINRMLIQHGFNSFVLSGGVLTFTAYYPEYAAKDVTAEMLAEATSAVHQGSCSLASFTLQ